MAKVRSAALERFTADASPAAIGQCLERNGAVIVEGLLAAPLLTALNAEFDALMAEADPVESHLNPALDYFFTGVRHLTGLAGKSRRFAEEVMCHPLMLALCDRILLENCAEYRLNLGHMMERGPGAPQQTFHRDQDIWPQFPDHSKHLLLATVVALKDFNAHNGATAIVPGSHRWPRERQPRGDEVAYAHMPAGAAVIYLGTTLHAGGANTTASEWRRGFRLSYALGWLATEENNVLAIPPCVARALSPRAQRLIGYGVHDSIKMGGGYLGMVDMRDPAELLAEGKL